jgi:ElaB/YqjD/DUF883 family membrane-anchored ribosome-binding protein
MDTPTETFPESYSAAARERVLKDLRTLATDAEALIRVTAHDVSEKAKEARDRLSVTIGKARASYEALQAQGLDSAKAAARQADDAIRKHPYESVGIAFGAGLLLGALMSRK